MGVFTWEVLLDMTVYGFWAAALCLASFSLVVFAFGDGNLGVGCNDSISPQCELVFRARATTFTCLTWFALFLAWEMVNMRRSFFHACLLVLYYGAESPVIHWHCLFRVPPYE